VNFKCLFTYKFGAVEEKIYSARRKSLYGEPIIQLILSAKAYTKSNSNFRYE